MPSQSQIPIASQAAPKRFATRLALFYGATYGTMGTHLPFFTLWLKSVGIDPTRKVRNRRTPNARVVRLTRRPRALKGG